MSSCGFWSPAPTRRAEISLRSKTTQLNNAHFNNFTKTVLARVPCSSQLLHFFEKYAHLDSNHSKHTKFSLENRFLRFYMIPKRCFHWALGDSSTPTQCLESWLSYQNLGISRIISHFLTRLDFLGYNKILISWQLLFPRNARLFLDSLARITSNFGFLDKKTRSVLCSHFVISFKNYSLRMTHSNPSEVCTKFLYDFVCYLTLFERF